MTNALPNEIYSNILSFATHDTALTSRLASKHLCSIATPQAVEHIWLEASYDVSGFINIAKTPHLRAHVREVTIETVVRDYDYFCNNSFKPPAAFFRALPYLRLFSGLKRLNIRFEKHCGNEDADYSGQSIEEKYEFRRWVLWSVFSCVSGDWDVERYQELYEDTNHDLYENGEVIDNDDFFNELTRETKLIGEMPPITLDALSIAHLADYYDTEFYHANVFQKVMASPTLKKLELYIVTEQCPAAPENATWFPEKWDFFESLKDTWLTPEVAKRLEVLSLFCDDLWGWCPMMDLREINSDAGPNSGFPRLKVLALGNYVFSHEWQMDWFSRLGLQNGYSGLQKLYLDYCPIMFGFMNFGPVDERPGTAGYPLKEVAIGNLQGYSAGVSRSLRMRWHHVLDHWKENMRGLRTLRIGQGAWEGELSQIAWDGIRETFPDAPDGVLTRLFHRLDGTNFRTYHCPSLPPADEKPEDATTYISGSGIRELEHEVMEYVHFDAGLGPSPWQEPELKDERAPEFLQIPKELDLQALEELRAVIQERN
ncbi:hypothetical protein F5Y15DRAFT_415498 [Xylariaceae sp. FL0016]|nr:hypothetical protein F5Y15DRAFT_415498 [Xylariaceae sp. FL0016]